MALDKLDLMILEELEEDPRQPVRVLAKKLGMKRTTVNYRLNRLKTEGVLNIACISNHEMLGIQFLLVIAIKIVSGKINDVVDELMPLSNVKVISLVSPSYSILAWTILPNRSALARFVSENLTKIPYITSFEIIHSYQWVRDVWRYFKPQVEITQECPQYRPDDLDFAIIKAMENDPRQTMTKLAETIGSSKSLAKSRLDKLLADGFIRFVSVVDPRALGYNIYVVILIKSEAEKTNAMVKELSMHSNARHVSLITGQWQILTVGFFQDSDQMNNYLTETLPSVAGILDYNIIHLVKNVKFMLNIFTL